LKKLALAALVVLACHKDDAAPQVKAEPSAVASASASAAPSVTESATASAAMNAPATSASAPVTASASPARVACGTITCAPTEFCLHYDPHGGGAYSPDKQPADATMCSKEILHTGSMNCGPANAARQVKCAAFIPRAPPHGDPNDPL